MELGTLERVDLRSVWHTEATDFTPWLAKAENIERLSEALGLNLEVLATEERVGPFRADIVCQEVDGEAKVLIENQLTVTDHNHLGQILTYASGLESVYMVWIAQRFTEEHRATLDWLNNVPDDSAQFFGIEIELWRIGRSQVAPKFQVVAKPNRWTKAIRKAATASFGPSEELKDFYEYYWGKFGEWAAAKCPDLQYGFGGRCAHIRVKLAADDCHIFTGILVRDRQIIIGLTLLGENTVQRLNKLESQKDEIRKELGVELDWGRAPDESKAWISTRRPAELIKEKETEWDEHFEWICKTSLRFKEIIDKRLSAPRAQ